MNVVQEPLAAPGEHLAAGRPGRDSLTGVLAREGRNAVARVELVASELARLATAPAIAERLDTIRQAVAEVDGLLGKIELLAQPAVDPPSLATAIDPVWRRVVGRLAAVLATRDLRLSPEPVGTPATVRLSDKGLEAVLLSALRWALARTPEQRGVWTLAVSEEEDAVRLGLGFEPDPGVDAEARSEGVAAAEGTSAGARVELELLLAESGGAIVEEGAAVWRLPAGAADD